MASKTKAVKSTAKKSTSVSQTLMNQRVVIWLLVGFVAFLTLWMLYTVKAMQAGTMGTASEAAVKPLDVGQSCTRADSSRGQVLTFKKDSSGKKGTARTVTCCKKKNTSQYYWVDTSDIYGNKCPGEGGNTTTETDYTGGVYKGSPTPTTRFTRPTGIGQPTPMDRN